MSRISVNETKKRQEIESSRNYKVVIIYIIHLSLKSHSRATFLSRFPLLFPDFSRFFAIGSLPGGEVENRSGNGSSGSLFLSLPFRPSSLSLHPPSSLRSSDPQLRWRRTNTIHYYHRYTRSSFESRKHPALARLLKRRQEWKPWEGFSPRWKTKGVLR